MALIVLGWAFAGFIYFKVAFEAGMHSGISIFAALLMAVVLGVTIFFSTGVYATKLLRYNLTPGAVRVSVWQLLGKTLFWFVLIAAGFALASWLVIFGFSERLSDQIEMLGYRRQINDEFITFLFIVTTPILLHYFMCLFSTHRTANQNPI